MELLSAIGFSTNVAWNIRQCVLIRGVCPCFIFILKPCDDCVCLFVQDSMSTRISFSRIVGYESESDTAGNRSNQHSKYLRTCIFLNVNITHLKKPCVLHFRIWKCFRSLKDLLFAIVLSMYIPGSQRHFVLIRVVCFCCLLIYWFLDDFNTHSYRIRYHDWCLGRSIKKAMFLGFGLHSCSEYAAFQCHEASMMNLI